MNQKRNYKFRSIKTSNLNLCPINLNDLSELFKLRSNDEVVKFVEKEVDKGIAHTKHFIQKIELGIQKDEVYYWGIHLKNKPQLIGTICLWNFNSHRLVAEIGFELHPDFHNKGIMFEASQAVIKFGFKKLQLKIISAHTNKLNEPSLKLLQKLNFKLSSTENKNLIFELANTIS